MAKLPAAVRIAVAAPSLMLLGCGSDYLAPAIVTLQAAAVAAAAATPPDLRFGPATCTGTLLVKVHYAVCHWDRWKVPLWVAYNLTAEETVDHVERQGRFAADPELAPGAAARPQDYEGSGYDIGHMAPADDFQFSRDAVVGTFLLSNAAPQSGAVNRGRWLRIEQEVSGLAEAHGSVWVYTGPLFLNAAGRPAPPAQFIGSGVAVPTHFFKVVLCEHAQAQFEMFAFLVPNAARPIPGPSARYLVSVDSVEVLSGVDFFAPLPDDVEGALEARAATVWPVSSR